MDLKRLRTFVTVAEQGTVSIAAEKLRITQPALSAHERFLTRPAVLSGSRRTFFSRAPLRKRCSHLRAKAMA